MHYLWLNFINHASDKQVISWATFAPIWYFVQSQFVDFVGSITVTVITLFWFCDLMLGTGRALYNKEFSPNKFVVGMRRWLLWMVALFVALMIRVSIPVVGGVLASLIESVIILAEGSSILRNLALISGDERVKRILNMYSDVISDKIDELVPGEENDLHNKEKE